jgi:hypothetical protein
VSTGPVRHLGAAWRHRAFACVSRMMYAIDVLPSCSSRSSPAVVQEADTGHQNSIAHIIAVDWSHRQRSRQTPRKVYHVTERNVMGLFSDLLSRIRGHADTAAPAAASTLEVPADTPSSDTPAPAPPVDVAAVLNGLAATHAERLDWQHSIVDLLKLIRYYPE